MPLNTFDDVVHLHCHRKFCNPLTLSSNHDFFFNISMKAGVLLVVSFSLASLMKSSVSGEFIFSKRIENLLKFHCSETNVTATHLHVFRGGLFEVRNLLF